MNGTLSPSDASQLEQTVEMFEVIARAQPDDCPSLEILKEAYSKLGREGEVVRVSRLIAEAHVQVGQFSSAILEYEGLLQRHPDNEEIRAALARIEGQANSQDQEPSASPAEQSPADPSPQSPQSPHRPPGGAAVDDGKQAMFKLFVDTNLISAEEFDLCWAPPDYSSSLRKAIEPFVQRLADRGSVPVDRSLAALSAKARLGFLTLDRYDMDLELARTFPPEVCMRWCALPFDRMSKSVLVATANPFNRQAAAELQVATSCHLIFYLAPPTDIMKGLKKAFH